MIWHPDPHLPPPGITHLSSILPLSSSVDATARIQGVVDLGALSSADTPAQISAASERVGPLCLSFPGVSLRVTNPDSVALEDEAVAVCLGQALFPSDPRDPSAKPGRSARAWIQAFRRHGQGAFARARGRFCVAIVCLRERTVFLATSRFAIVPLCFSIDGGRIAFSDRADQIPLSGSAELDQQAIYNYLYFHVIPAPQTIFRGVVRMGGAETIRFDMHGSHRSRHWIPQFDGHGRSKIEDLKVEFRGLLTDAVAAEAERGGAGAFLSGGTDSSTVAGVLGQVTGKPASTYSMGFATEGYDEMEYARITARHFGTDHHEYYVSPADILRGIPLIAAQYDQPFGNSSAVPTLCCAALARSAGITTLLAGDGGDELFGGNVRYTKQQLLRIYGGVPRYLRARLIEPLLLGNAIAGKLPLVSKLTSYVEQARISMPARMETHNLLERLGPKSVLTPEFLRDIDRGGPSALQREVYEACDADAQINRMLAYDWKFTLADNDLPKVRGSSNLAGVEVGFPLLSDDLVDFSLKLSPEMKIRGLRLRYFFKEALRDFLPPEVIAKKKHGFGLPFGVWLARDDDLRDFAASTLSRLGQRGIVRQEFLNELMTTMLPTHPGYYGEMVWILIMLEQWLHAQSVRAAARSALSQDERKWAFAT